MKPALLCLAISLLLAPASALAQDRTIGAALDVALREVAPLARTGVLADRVLGLARLEQLDGGNAAPAADGSRFRQALSELERAATGPWLAPSLRAIETSAQAARRAGELPLALLDVGYERVRPGALEDGTLAVQDGRLVARDRSALVAARAVAGAVLAPGTRRGGRVTFALDAERFVTDAGAPRRLTIDFADGRGPREVAWGERVHVHYDAPGRHVLEARLVRADGSEAQARFTFEVEGLAAPLPDDTLQITATIPHAGVFGTGRAYVALAPGHTDLVNPVVVVEGFDLDNAMSWDELHALLDQQGLLTSLLADGFDAVVLDFDDATAAIQQNAFVVAELIAQVQARIAPQATLAVVGASMGALCSRYALAHMETHALPHRVRTWISFDGPQAGADIPLGLQYWIDFFAGQSADAAAFRAVLDRPAARQMLLHRLTVPPSATASADPLRAALLADLAAIGDYPQLTRRVAVANGSGTGLSQGFAPAAQLIQYEYSSFLAAVTGNVWAVPASASQRIFQGSLRILFSTTTRNVDVNATQPWDGAPGGSRASMAELDATTAPFGDIVALHPAHCFIPTVSALALQTTDPFFAIASAPDPLALTPFDALFHPAIDEPHVHLSAESAAWIRAELLEGVLDAPVPLAGGGHLALRAAPSPFTHATSIALTLPRAAAADLRVYAIDGREVRTLARGPLAAGTHTLAWDGRDADGRTAPPGLYLLRGRAGDAAVARRVVKLR